MEDLNKHLESMQELPESDSYPPVPPAARGAAALQQAAAAAAPTQGLHHTLGLARECLRASRDITIAAFEGAKSTLGAMRAVVCVPPPELLQVRLHTAPSS